MPVLPLRRVICEGEHFTFRLRTDALKSANIPGGSRLLAHETNSARDGDLVIVETPQGKLVRFYKSCGSGLYLTARNPQVPPLILPGNAASIVGIVCALLT